LEAASRKYNFQVHFPSAGVGGPCLPVNSYQMINSANKIDESFLQLVRTSRKINEKMPEHVVELLLECLSSIGKSLESSNILILGVSYKPNVKDVQISPAENVIKILKSRNAKIRIFDPFFINEKVFDFETENNLGNALKISDAVVIITPHDELKTITVEFIVANMKNPIIVDSVGMIDINAAKKAGIIYRCIGRDRTG
jgi:nucleotide sugar dehydrogenase